MRGPRDDLVTCRLEVDADFKWATLYALAGSNFPLYADEKYIGDVPLTFLEKHGIHIAAPIDTNDWGASIPVGVLDEIERQTANGWGE